MMVIIKNIDILIIFSIELKFANDLNFIFCW